MTKTNAMRILDQKKINYEAHSYSTNDGIDGISVANSINKDSIMVYKTLVTKHEKENFVFIIPVASELDLKKAAAAAGVKTIEMINQKDLLPLTGYVHGGCSPIGMKKKLKTFIHEDAKNLNTLVISAGKIGLQVELSPSDLAEIVDAIFEDIIK